jgi:hypothetical protein
LGLNLSLSTNWRAAASSFLAGRLFSPIAGARCTHGSQAGSEGLRAKPDLFINLFELDCRTRLQLIQIVPIYSGKGNGGETQVSQLVAGLAARRMGIAGETGQESLRRQLVDWIRFVA